jgi:cytidyltransferase-like protein
MNIVLAVGVFDIFHVGHLHHLQAAKAMGDTLFVGVTRDAFVGKGPGRPVFNVAQRTAILQALAIVDQVLHVDGSLDALKRVKPHVFALGNEYRGKVRREDVAYCDEYGIEILFTNGPVFSSTELLHHYARLEQS